MIVKRFLQNYYPMLSIFFFPAGTKGYTLSLLFILIRANLGLSLLLGKEDFRYYHQDLRK